jgi:protein phosphatase 1B
MGAFLEKPITTKESHSGNGNGLLYALSSMQGWRIEMEVGFWSRERNPS